MQQAALPTLNQRMACSFNPMQLGSSTMGTFPQAQFAMNHWQQSATQTTEHRNTAQAAEEDLLLNQRLVEAIAQRQVEMQLQRVQFQEASLGAALHKARPSKQMLQVCFCFGVPFFFMTSLSIEDTPAPEDPGQPDLQADQSVQPHEAIWEYDLQDDIPAVGQSVEEGSTEEEMMSPADPSEINDDDLAGTLYQNFTELDPYAVDGCAETADKTADLALEKSNKKLRRT
eukprot:s830_g25.t1